ncbi:TIGR01777 family oxidoreductase [Catenulispora pinisilvae]|uniref:TIGR01777 family oxidoreductase n=1 Tax=Catenulispora pinisilvae TaxID=2705253 RepID=UPI001890DB70|nr:TIGR01777 family oxidoreductase [Catenulispora pinisilvae]
MKIAVAGASGALGSAIVRELGDSGHTVFRLVRGESRGLDEIGWDPSYGRIPAGALSGLDAVVNLYSTGLAGKRWNAAQKQKIRDSRVVAADTLATAVRDCGVPLLLNGSETAYYGDTQDRQVSEGDPVGTGFHAELCRDWEAAAEAAGPDTRLLLLRFGTVLGRNSGVVKAQAPAFRAFLGGRLGRGDQYLPWITMADAAAAVRFLMTADGVSGPVNVTAPDPRPQREFAAALGRALGRPALWTLPRPVLRAALGEYADGFYTGQRAVPEVLTAAGFEFRHAELGAALDAVLKTGS